MLGGTVRIRGALVQVGPHRIDRDRWDWEQVNQNPFFCPDITAAEVWETYLSEVRKSGSSAGAVIEVVAEGVPPEVPVGIADVQFSFQEVADHLRALNGPLGLVSRDTQLECPLTIRLRVPLTKTRRGQLSAHRLDLACCLNLDHPAAPLSFPGLCGITIPVLL